MPRRATRLALSAAAAAAAAVALGAPTPALGCGWEITCNPPVPKLDSGGAGNGSGGTVNGTCTAVAGAATDLSKVTYAFHANATSASTNSKQVPVGTGVVCVIKNAATGTVYGTARGGLPGPTAEAVGTATVPASAPIRVCVDSNAVFADGTTARDANC